MSGDRLHDTWLTSERIVPRRILRPLLRFTHVEASGGVVLLIATILALIWANAPFGESYERFWETTVVLGIGENLKIEETLRGLVNDGLMTIFFFVVGLEIKRELVVGELRDPRRAALPAIAALGGVVLPALIYIIVTAGTGAEAARGWGIPMATDIAFAVGVLALLGSRVTVGAKLFLLALAIIDDIVAIAVIAIFYTSKLSIPWLTLGIIGLAAVWVATKVGIRSTGFYVVLGVVSWFFVFESGVHATLAGVALGFLTPARPWYEGKVYLERSRNILERYEETPSPAGSPPDAATLAAIAREARSPLERMMAALHPWSSFVIVPLFALANAGLRFAGIDVVAAATGAVAVGVAGGLVIGKTLGITAATVIAVRSGVGRLPAHTTWRQIVGVAAVAGIGFTVALFISDLAFTSTALTDQAKIGIFIGSTGAGILGWLLLRSGGSEPETPG